MSGSYHARNPSGVPALGLAVSDPPTQAELQAVAAKLDELIAALRREPQGRGRSAVLVKN